LPYPQHLGSPLHPKLFAQLSAPLCSTWLYVHERGETGVVEKGGRSVSFDTSLIVIGPLTSSPGTQLLRFSETRSLFFLEQIAPLKRGGIALNIFGS
jgi:hypothetical protein